MAKSAKHFEEFEPHSQHKHLILEKYFESWGRKMLLRPGSGDLLLYVDACAGRGMDDVGNHGSPIIAARAAVMAEVQLSEMRGRHSRVQVIAIERQPSHFRALSENLAPFGERARTLRGTLGEHLPPLNEEFSDTPTLYFIDPFGLEPLQAAVVRQALAGPKNEALLLFADQAALRHFGVISAEETRAEKKLRRHDDQPPSLFPEMIASERDGLARRAIKSREHLEITREKALEILNAAFGDSDWLGVIEDTPPKRRRAKFLELYREFLASCGACYILSIPVLNDEGGYVYSLIHASKSKHGYTTMKESVEYALKHGPLPDDVKEEMRGQLRCDLDEIERTIRVHFAGADVPWAENKADKRAPCVRNFVLEGTPLFPFQVADLQKRLANARLPGRTISYRFPSSA